MSCWCKKFLIIKTLYISHITKLSGPRVLFVEVGRKIRSVTSFWAIFDMTLKKNLIYIFKKKVMSCAFCERRVPPSGFSENDFFRKTKFTDLLEMVWRIIFRKFFWRAPRARGPKSWLKFSNLLFLVVATNQNYRFFLYRFVGAHLKNFARARAPTLRKNSLNIKYIHEYT